MQNSIREYWETSTPMCFKPEGWSYESKRSFRYALQDYMHDEFGYAEWAGKQVLEVGCGAGIDTLEFTRNGAVVTATDITDNAVKTTAELAIEAVLPVTLVKASALALPFHDGSFDCVYSYGVLHHIPDVECALNEITRVLKDDGKLLAMLYNRNSLLYAYSIIYRHGLKEGLLTTSVCTEQDLMSRYSERHEGCPYSRAYTKEETEDLFSKWFGDVNVCVRYNVVDTDIERKVKLELDDRYELGWHLVVVATKKVGRV